MVEKATQVRVMFTNIAPRYDLLNRVLSLGIDRRWRAQAARAALEGKPARVLDVATGTGDLALAMAALAPEVEIIGIDFTKEMLELARAKAQAVGASIDFRYGDGMALPYEDASMDALTIAYGLRNFADLDAGLREFYRVLRPGGRLVVLEFPPPPEGIVGAVFRGYFQHVLPRIGGWVSRDAGAYRYLPRSVLAFPAPSDLALRMRTAGFASVSYRLQTFGVSALHLGEKNE